MKVFTSGGSKSWNVEHQYDDKESELKDFESPERDDISTISGGSKPPNYSKNPSVIMESPTEKRLRKRSQWVAYLTMFVMTVGFSVVLSGVWPYLTIMYPDLQKESLGWVVAANPLGQMVASPLVGYLGNRFGSIRIVCYFTMVFFILGNVVYALLPHMTDWWYHSAYHIMIIARFIVGVSSANVSLCRAYIASSTTAKERTTGMAIISAAQSLGFVVGPAAQTVLSLIINEDLDKYTAAGWLAASLGVINFVLLTPWIFQEYNIGEQERLLLQGTGDAPKYIIPKADYLAVSAILFGFFMDQFIFVLLETLMEPFVADQYAWCNDLAVVTVGILFAFGGLLNVAMYFTSIKLAKIYDERLILLLCCFLPVTIGVFLFIPWGPQTLNYCENATETESSFLYFENHFQHPVPNLYRIDNFDNDMLRDGIDKWCDKGPCYGCPPEQEWCDGYDKLPMAQFLIAYVIVLSGYPFGISMSNGIYSKMLGPKPQGVWMGILTAAGSLSRVIGPIFVSYIYTNKGTKLTFLVLLIGMILAACVLILFFRRLVPMKVEKVKDPNRK